MDTTPASPKYLLIGNGRIATHFQYYFSLLKISFNTWHRGLSNTTLRQLIDHASHILLLISDDAIEQFSQQHLRDKKIYRIHCSGSLVSDEIYGAHPLMTFSHRLYDLKQYQSIPFIVDADAPPLVEILPGLPNQHFYLSKAMKAKYHALSVMSANFSCLLWQKFFNSLDHEFKLGSSIGHPLLLQQMKNLLEDHHSALTGPLVRNDTATIEKHLTALAADPFQEIYQSFVACFSKIKPSKEIQ